ncbi:MAG: signal transduction histidine kinase/ActR/RegA family two-component response regulator [Candidatus Azotimanducaceae bacterium]|jgi:signal transduction histidine kinase/ActR/RegA family two-component response regulator
MLQDTLNVLRRQFLGLSRVLSTVTELVSNGLLFDDESALLNYAAKLLINNHNFRFCTIHSFKNGTLHLACATSTDSILDPTTREGEKEWVSTCEHLAKQLLERNDKEIMKRQSENSNYYSMPIVYRDEILAILTVNSPSFDDNHPKLISIFCNTLTSVLINSRDSQHLTQAVASRTEQLESALQMASDSANAKSQFLTNMSHEYLTPLNAITGMSALLIDTSLDSEQVEYVDNVVSASNDLQTLVQDMLSYSSTNEGNFSLGISNLHELLQAINDTFVSRAQTKGLELELLLHSDLPVFVITDEQLLKQILSILVSNAIKFTNTGRVTIDAYCSELNPSEANIKFTVLDTGIGIEEKELDTIFNVLHQIDNSATRKFQGAGLGLAICQKTAKLFKSKIKVNSILGEGSEFYFSVRFKTERENKNEWEKSEVLLDLMVEENKTEAKQAKFRNHLSVLLVEDNLINQKLASRLLEKMGCFVDIANDGVDAVDMFSKTAYDLIFMDCQMPNMDGFEATTRIRGMESGNRTPIIALTANSLPEDRARSFDAGMDEFLTKPILKEKLQSALIKWISP